MSAGSPDAKSTRGACFLRAAAKAAGFDPANFNFDTVIFTGSPGSFGGQAYVVQGTSPATAYASGVAAGFKGINCDTWQQIQAMMQQKFPVPSK